MCLSLPLRLGHRRLHPRLDPPGYRCVLFLGQGTLAQCMAATCPVSSLWLRAKPCLDSRVGVPVCVWVCVWLFFSWL